MRNRISTAVAFALAAVMATAVPAYGQDRFNVPLTRPGQPVRLEVTLVFGSITVESHSGPDVVVEIQDPADEVKPPPARGPAQGMRRLPNRSSGLVIEEEDNHVKVSSGGPPRRATLKVLVPRQTSLKLATVNDGDIRVQGVEGELELRNTNGDIHLRDVGGAVVAHTVNGEVKATLSRLDPRGALRMRSDNGEIFTDFDVELTARPARVEEQRSGGRYRLEVEREVSGTINGGGAEIAVRTFNGNIYLRKRGG
jgi:hypothetical protein